MHESHPEGKTQCSKCGSHGLVIFPVKCTYDFVYYFFFHPELDLEELNVCPHLDLAEKCLQVFLSQEAVIGIFMNILPETDYIVLFLLCHLQFIDMFVWFSFLLL